MWRSNWLLVCNHCINHLITPTKAECPWCGKTASKPSSFSKGALLLKHSFPAFVLHKCGASSKGGLIVIYFCSLTSPLTCFLAIDSIFLCPTCRVDFHEGIRRFSVMRILCYKRQQLAQRVKSSHVSVVLIFAAQTVEQWVRKASSCYRVSPKNTLRECRTT